MRIFGILLLLCFTSPVINYGQTPFCGLDELRNNWIIKDSQYLLGEQKMNKRIYEAIVNGAIQRAAGSSLVIPVVVHIMHNNGPENLPDSVIIKAVNDLNLRFQNAPPFYDTTGNFMNIQFCLATVDPQGNPTSGITRTVTTLTNINISSDDENMKNLSRWSPLLYCNIWVVNDISGFPAGYATYPNYAGSSVDGIVVEAAYVPNSYILAHEMGHYCGLAHTFSFSCTNLNCLLDGDQVCDTPPDTTQFFTPCMGNSCSSDTQDTTGLSPFTFDVNELPNYMDYTTCPLSFTYGQGERMEVMIMLYRSLLLNSNGCGANPGGTIPIAGFNFLASSCNNGKIAFSDSTSMNALTTEWDFDNDGIFERYGHNLVYTFPASGIYLVTQRVTGFGGQDTVSHTVTVMKGTTFNYPIVSPTVLTDTLKVCAGNTLTFTGDSGAVSYLWSTGATTQSISFAASTNLDISLTMTDATGFTWSSQCTPIYVKVYPNDVPVITSNDSAGLICQGELLTLYITNPVAGVYTWQVYNTPTGWFNTMDHNLIYNYYPHPTFGNQFYVTYTNPAGCNQQSNIVTVQPQPIPFLNGTPLFSNGYDIFINFINCQLQWYNYNTPIPGATTNGYTVTSTGCYRLKGWYSQYPDCFSFTDTLCFEFTGIAEQGHQLIISPNPASDIVTISGVEGQGEMNYHVWDMVGKKIMTSGVIREEKFIKLSCTNWNSGIYILDLSNGHTMIRKKIVITRD